MINETIISPIIDINIDTTINIDTDVTITDENTLENTDNYTIEEIDIECPICFEHLESAITMKCCSNQVCDKCYREWHLSLENPSCAFCRADDEFFSVSIPPNMEIENEEEQQQQLNNYRNHIIVHTICPTLCIFAYLTSTFVVYAIILIIKT